jgi:hypothetical protein
MGAWILVGHGNRARASPTSTRQLRLIRLRFAYRFTFTPIRRPARSAESGDDITIVFATAHPFVTATLARVSGITGLTPDPNGNRQITVIDATTIEITVVGLSGSIAGTAVVGAPRLEDDAVNAVYGSCLFSDPNTNNTEYIVIATNGVCLRNQVVRWIRNSN